MRDPSTALLAAFLLTAEGVSVVAVALRITGRLVPDRGDWAMRVLVGVVVALSQLLGVMTVLGMVGALDRWTVLAAHLLVAAAVLWRVRPGPRPAPAPPPVPAGWRRASRLGLGAVLAYAAVLAVQLSVNGAPADADDVQYHVPNAVHWVQAHSLWGLPVANPGYFTNAYPSNGELLGSWLILPSHGVQVVCLATLLFGALLVAACAVVSQELGGSAHRGALASVAVLLTPLSFQTQVHSLLTDWASAAGVVAAVALVLRARPAPEAISTARPAPEAISAARPAPEAISTARRGGFRWALLAGLALGIGVGSKDTAVIPAVAVFVLVLVVVPVRRWLTAAALVGGTVLLSGVWFVRTGIATGNPIFPEPVRVGGHVIFTGGVSPLTRLSTSLLQDVTHGATGPLHAWEHFVRLNVGPAVVIAAVAVFGLARPRRRRDLFACTLVAAVLFLAYLATPYTGPAGYPALISSQLRYVMPALFLAAALASVMTRWLVPVSWVVIAWGLWKDLHGVAFRPDIAPSARMVAVALVGAAVALIVGWRVGWRGGWRRGGLDAVVPATGPPAEDRPVAERQLVGALRAESGGSGRAPVAPMPVGRCAKPLDHSAAAAAIGGRRVGCRRPRRRRCCRRDHRPRDARGHAARSADGG